MVLDLLRNVKPELRMTMARAAVAAMVLGVGVPACSGGTGSSATGSRRGTSTVPSPAQVSADHARAVAAVLRPSDLPAGWTASAHISGPGVPGLDRQLASCLGVSVGLLNGNDPTNADSPDFSGADGGEISSSVGYEPSLGRAHAVGALLQSPRMAPCLNSAIRTFLLFRLAHPSSPGQSVPAGVGLGQPTTTRVPFPTIGDLTVAYRFVVPVEGAGTPLTVFGDFLFAGKGRAGTVLTVESRGSAPDSLLERRLVATVVGRLTS